MNARTCFDILRIPPDASLDEAKESYKRLVKLWHPDQYGNFPEKQMIAQEKLKEINVAYRDIVSILKSNPDRSVTPSGRRDTQQQQPEENPPAPPKKGASFWNQVALFFSTSISKSNRSEDPEETSPLPTGITQRESVAFAGREGGTAPDFQQILKSALRERRLSGAARQRYGERQRVRRRIGSASSYRAETTTRRGSGDRVEKIIPVGRVNRIGGD